MPADKDEGRILELVELLENVCQICSPFVLRYYEFEGN